MISYTLSMPTVGSWDRKCSGDDKSFVLLRPEARGKEARQKEEEKLAKGRFYYRFGDGWTALIVVEKVDNKTAWKLKKSSAGFCGYDWMVDSIEQYGSILSPEKIAEIEDRKRTEKFETEMYEKARKEIEASKRKQMLESGWNQSVGCNEMNSLLSRVQSEALDILFVTLESFALEKDLDSLSITGKYSVVGTKGDGREVFDLNIMERYTDVFGKDGIIGKRWEKDKGWS